MEKQVINLWEQVGNECLRQATDLLKKETTLTEATVKVVRELVEMAISIDTLNLRWVVENPSGTQAYVGRTF